jgi:hypothetical protein
MTLRFVPEERILTTTAVKTSKPTRKEIVGVTYFEILSTLIRGDRRMTNLPVIAGIRTEDEDSTPLSKTG